MVAIDKAHLLDDSAPSKLRLLLNFENESQPGLTLLLVGQPGCWHKWSGCRRWRSIGSEVPATAFHCR